ncbi:DUF7672 family protein [Winogradskyella bathintestinalis]|uniref:Uncharacterized protein n=1 Tax=Winogradskyella bathintestinalis TaxID=3035208 RepID=A0ABT7ZU75_9FLAO|nr:hypothetical protein [Winogradskyella bathintestinalis]MDN3492555.1 hypothetical protein [Winogradskyella bathintestinalis]
MELNHLIRLYVIGLTILIIAILANGIIGKLGLKSWYGFIELLSKNGSTAFRQLTVIDYLWLFIGYPLVLGFGYWLGDKLFHLLFG